LYSLRANRGAIVRVQRLWHHGSKEFLEFEGEMSEEQGKCPSCDEVGVVGDACQGVACRKRGYHFIPQDFWDRAHAQEDKSPDALIGQLIGDFLLVDTVGAGGFGKVCLALQSPIFRLRGALKLLEFPNDDPEFQRALLEKFQGEAEVLAELSHPNVVSLIKYGIHENRPYLVMEYLENGLTLRDEMYRRAKAKRGFNREDLRHIFHQMLNGLAAAHGQKIIHRDLKPENIMLQRVVGNPAHVRILDFGIAKFVEGQTDTKWPLGSPSYMAPEQVSLQNLGTWTDLYAVGVMFFEMVTGRRPFPGNSDEAIMSKKLKADFDPFEQVADLKLPEPAVAFMRRAMSREPGDRQQTVLEFRGELDVALAALEEHSEIIGPQGREMTFLLKSRDVVELGGLVADGGTSHPPQLPEDARTRAAESGSEVDSAAISSQSVDAYEKALRRRGRGRLLFALIAAALAAGAYYAREDLRRIISHEISGITAANEAFVTEVEPDAGPAVVAPPAPTPDEMTATLAVDSAESVAMIAEAAAADIVAASEAAPKLPGWAFTQLTAGKYHTCGLRVDGKFRCWGANFEGELGLGHTRALGDNEAVNAVEPVALSLPVQQLVATGDRQASFTCALLEDRSVRCWGANRHGQLGYGHTRALGDDEAIANLAPVQLGAPAIQLTAGASKFGSHVCALLEDQTIRCWGSAKFGKLGLGHTNDVGDDEPPTSAAKISVGGKALAIEAGKYNTCAILEDRSLRCWGWNAQGQLGLGHTRDIGDDEVPSSVAPIEMGGEVMQVSVGRRHSCAVLAGGKVRCWGWNNSGQLGLGHTENIGDDETPASVEPVELSGPAIKVVTGALHSCALLDVGESDAGEASGGKIQCWGDNKFGQLGYGHERTVGDESTPSSVGTVYLGAPAVDLTAGRYHTCALLVGGGVRCWGFNDQGQLGYGHINLIGDDETPASVGKVSIAPAK
jgi:serine/threonine protein kinase/alpha-tubulin suppressor-like RCC1 family protein